MARNTRNWRSWLKQAEGYFGARLDLDLVADAFHAFRHGVAPLDYVASVCR